MALASTVPHLDRRAALRATRWHQPEITTMAALTQQRSYEARGTVASVPHVRPGNCEEGGMIALPLRVEGFPAIFSKTEKMKPL